MMISNRNYNYILIENTFYVNVDQRLIELFFILYGRTKALPFFRRKTTVSIINCLPESMIRLVRVLQFTCKFHKAKKDPELRKTLAHIRTKHFGQCLLKLRKGEIKIFNLKEQKVITEFQSLVSVTEIQHRINSLEKVKDLAPELISWNLEERYIVEVYMNFRRPSYEFNNLEKYYSEVFPILEQIRSNSKPMLFDLQVYVLSKLSYLESEIDVILSNDPGAKVDTIKDFIPILRKSLKNFQTKQELFILSHGDFWEGNILIKDNNTCIIDWETLDYRSYYFDFYFSMFMLVAKSKSDKVEENTNNLVQHLESAFKLFSKRIKEGNHCSTSTDMSTNLQAFDKYRFLFYLELIHLKLQSNCLSKYGEGEVKAWINRFQLFEHHLKVDG